MFSKIRRLLSKVKKDRPAGKMDAKAYLVQADLSQQMMLSIGLAMKLDLKVYVRLDIGNKTHAFSIQGKDDPILKYLYELASDSQKDSIEAANKALLEDMAKTGGMEGV